MSKYLLSSFFIFALVGVGSFLSRYLGWYNSYWFADVILHTLSGVGFGLVWLGLIRTEQSVFIRILGTVSFAALGSTLWEFWEYAGWRITPSQTRFYIPELGDTLSDVICGIIGGLLCCTTYLLYRRIIKERIFSKQ